MLQQGISIKFPFILLTHRQHTEIQRTPDFPPFTGIKMFIWNRIENLEQNVSDSWKFRAECFWLLKISNRMFLTLEKFEQNVSDSWKCFWLLKILNRIFMTLENFTWKVKSATVSVEGNVWLLKFCAQASNMILEVWGMIKCLHIFIQLTQPTCPEDQSQVYGMVHNSQE